MELKDTEVSDGKLWLLCAGACALALSFFVYRVDEYMSHAPAREHNHNLMMNELRSAQTGLSVGAVDHRQALSIEIEKKSEVALPHDVAAGTSAAHGSGHQEAAHH